MGPGDEANTGVYVSRMLLSLLLVTELMTQVPTSVHGWHLHSLVPRPHPSQGGKGVWLQYDTPLDP